MGCAVTTFGRASVSAVIETSVVLKVPMENAPPSPISVFMVMSVMSEAFITVVPISTYADAYPIGDRDASMKPCDTVLIFTSPQIQAEAVPIRS